MFEQSANTKKLVELLRAVNGSIKYETIVGHIGQPLGKIYSALGSARDILQKEKIVFAVERGVGLRRLNNSETMQSSEKFTKRIRNASKRGLKRLDAVEFSQLSNVDQMTATINRTMFEAIKQHTSLRKPAEQPVSNNITKLLATVVK